ncbi:fimbrial protein [Serratia proteamaculans]
MKINKTWCRLLVGLPLGLFLNGALAASPPQLSVEYRGNLVAEPCTLLPENESIMVDFGTLVDKYLYLNTRTQGAPFQLQLTDCDLSLGKSLKVTFSGTESVALPGLLALTAGSQASGIAIGMETVQGEPLPLNVASGKYPLQDGNTVIRLQAYIQGEPDALADKTLGRGAFHAIATFNLEYE